MSNYKLRKKLRPAKKAWKSFIDTLQSQLRKLKLSKAIENAKHRFVALRPMNSLVPQKLRSLIRRSSSCSFSRCHRNGNQAHYQIHHYHQEQHLQSKVAAIYVDELFARQIHPPTEATKGKEAMASSSNARDAKAEATSTKTDKQFKNQRNDSGLGVKGFAETTVVQRETEATGSSILTLADAWKVATASKPQIKGVDERAEEFISNFHEEIKIQKEQSILDFQEMLARSA